MPNYTFIHKDTGEEKTLFLSFAERDTWLEENTDWKQKLNTVGFITASKSMYAKTDIDFRSRMKAMKKHAGRGNRIKV